MITKLIRVDDVYRLVEVTKHGNSIIGTTDLDYQKTWSDRCRKLSLINCQAIERGYDLDEFSQSSATSNGINTFEYPYFRQGFGSGFQKRDEMLSEKKFSEDEMIEFGTFMGEIDRLNFELPDGSLSHGDINVLFNYWKSLQQTEWDVEIMVDICGDKVYAVPEFRMDDNDCLILKRI